MNLFSRLWYKRTINSQKTVSHVVSKLRVSHGCRKWIEREYSGGEKYCSLGETSGFGGLEVACWPLVPKFAGSNLTEAVGFLRVNKNPQHVGGHGCLSVVIVVCCQVEVSATN